MSCRIEPLEGRTLFTVFVGPTDVQTAYDALVVDATRLKTNVAAESKVLAKDNRVIAADVKAIGKSAANTMLLRQVQAATAKTIAGLSGATSRYLSASRLPYYYLAISAGYVEVSLTPANAKRLTIFQDKVQAVAGKQFAALVATAANGSGTLANAYTALAGANPAATQLVTDLGAAQNDLSAQTTTENAEVSATQTHIDTLLSVN